MDQSAEILAQLRVLREAVTEIKAQTTATNGRVRKIEIWQARMDGARSAFQWVQPAFAAVVSGLVVAGVLALLHFT